jgi:hypothetical protein
MPFTGNFTCNVFKTGLLRGEFDFSPTSPDVYKIALYTNDATLNQDTLAYTTVGEVVAPGYTAGGEILTPTVGALDNTSYISFADVTWNAAFTARGALVYKVGAGDPAVFVLDFGADRTSTLTFTVQFPPATNTSAILRIR